MPSHLLHMKHYTKEPSQSPISVSYSGSGNVHGTRIDVISAKGNDFIILDEVYFVVDDPTVRVQIKYIDEDNVQTLEDSMTIENLYKYGMTDHTITDQFYCFRYDTVNNIYGVKLKSETNLYVPSKRIEIYILHTTPFSYLYSASYFKGKIPGRGGN